MQGNLFSECHPVILFFYFTLVIITTMFTAHPVVTLISFAAAVSYRLCLGERKRFLCYQILWMLPMFCLIVLFNAAFNHYGITPLYYMKTGAVTLEAIVYGAVLGMMLWTSILWFSSVNLLFTTDQFVYLFGRVFPSLGLFLSMVFRFVPRFREKWTRIREGQACLGRDIFQQNFSGKLKCAVSELSILLTWAFESSVILVDSMHSRGYGTGRRTFYQIYFFSFWDKMIAAGGSLLFLGSAAGLCHGAGKSQYDPWIHLGGLPLRMDSTITYVFWLLFCFYPVLVSGFGKIREKQQGIMEKRGEADASI